MTRILFVQLPPPRFLFEEAPSNIPLAAGFLVSALAMTGAAAVEAEVAGPEVVDTFCDRGLVERIAQGTPDVVAFSLYVWNVQRSLFLAAALKRRLPGVGIVAGGPEVTPDNRWVLEHPAVDAGVFGEGESRIEAVIAAVSGRGAFGEIPGTFRKRAQGVWINAENPGPWDLSRCSYPYLDGTIGPSGDGTLFLETVRGCPFRCRYCYYHKAFAGVRGYPLSAVRQALDMAYAMDSGVREVYLMDPTFNATREFSVLLRHIISRRRAEFPRLHTELRADLLTADDVDLLSEAGLASAEIGLQTINPDALQLAGRGGSPDKTARGVELLKKAGIEVTTGIILGLPGDSPQGFSATLEWLTRTGAYSIVHPFVLSVLPGTDFRAHAAQLGLNHYDRPPYYVRSTNTFRREDFRSALLECEESFDMELDYIAPPSLIDRGHGLLRDPDDADYVSKWIIDLDSSDPLRLLAEISVKATDPFTCWFRGRRFKDSETVVLQILRGFAEANPHTVVHVVLEFHEPPETSFFDTAIDLTSQPYTYLNRSFEPLYGEGSVVNPVFVLVWPDPGLSRVRDAVRERYGSVATVIWDQAHVNRERLLQAEPPSIVSWSEGEGGRRTEELLAALYDVHHTRPEEIRFREPMLQEQWDGLTRRRRPAALFQEKILLTA
ncbi:MAG: radical SAM protein [Desulfomonilaceae bacterium]|nr:radical SAM protein [Desulfomonilaceae bacterium]